MAVGALSSPQRGKKSAPRLGPQKSAPAKADENRLGRTQRSHAYVKCRARDCGDTGQTISTSSWSMAVSLNTDQYVRTHDACAFQRIADADCLALSPASGAHQPHTDRHASDLLHRSTLTRDGRCLPDRHLLERNRQPLDEPGRNKKRIDKSGWAGRRECRYSALEAPLAPRLRGFQAWGCRQGCAASRGLCIKWRALKADRKVREHSPAGRGGRG